MKQLLTFGFSVLCLPLPAADAGFVSLFNGRDLSGWVNANCAPETWSVRDGVIHCTGRPTGAMRTSRQYENFILEVEWRHLSSGGNSGVFIWGTPIAAPGVPFLRGIEVQVLDHGYNAAGKGEWYTTHGDVFPIHGATMKPFGRHNGMRSFPSSEHSKGSPEWNHYRIVCSNGVIRLSVNGTEVSGGEECNYRKGYLALESEGAPVEFRNLRLQELPASGAPPELTAPLDQDWRALFNGLDLRGWRTNTTTADLWGVSGERLRQKGTTNHGNLKAALLTESDYGDVEFIVDYRAAKPVAGPAGASSPGLSPALQLRVSEKAWFSTALPEPEPGQYQRYRVTVQGRDVTIRKGEKVLARQRMPSDVPPRGPIGLLPTAAGAEFMNLYVREL